MEYSTDKANEKENENGLHLQLHSQAETEQIALDGKTMRGTIPYGETCGEHLISGYSVEKGTVLTQEAVDCKENEIVVAPVALAEVDLLGQGGELAEPLGPIG
jgi:hypothetical protein